MSSTPTIFVTAATGAQSSGLIRALSAWATDNSTPVTVNATTRDPSSASAQILLSRNHAHCTIKLFKADFEDANTLIAPATNATHAFINVTPDLTDLTAELRQGYNILTTLRAHAANTLSRIIYTSVASVQDPSDPTSYAPGTLAPGTLMHTYYSSKYELEVATKTLATEISIPYTILQPGIFLTNFLPPASSFTYPDLATTHTITTALYPTFRTSWLDPADIGLVATQALLLPASSPAYQTRYANRTVEMAQCVMTLADVVDSLNAHLAADPLVAPEGVRVTLVYMDEHEAQERAAQEPLVASRLFMNANDGGRFVVDLEPVRALGVPMATPAEFWAREAGRVREAVGVRA